MNRVLLIMCVFAFPIAVNAEAITFTNAHTTFTLPAGFTPSTDAPNPKWLYFTNANGAGIRVMPLMSTTLLPDASGNIETFWAAQLNATPFAGEIKFVTTLDICRGAECAAVTFSGSLAYGADGLVWTLPPGAQSFALGGDIYHLIPALNTRTGVIVPRDGAFHIQPARTEVPEPATLMLLGSGLAGLATMMRKRKR